MSSNNIHPMLYSNSEPKPGWIGIDLDGTLAEYGEWRGPGHIGDPIEPMVEFVRGLLALGWDVKLFTARAGLQGVEATQFWQAWAPWSRKQFGGRILPVTDKKDFRMVQLYDDRAVPIEHNTGRILMTLGG